MTTVVLLIPLPHPIVILDAHGLFNLEGDRSAY